MSENLGINAQLHDVLPIGCNCGESKTLVKSLTKIVLGGVDVASAQNKLQDIVGDCLGSNEREISCCGLDPQICNHPNGGRWVIDQAVAVSQQKNGASF